MLSSLKISHRLALGFGSLVVLIAFLGIFSVQQIHLLGEQTQDLYLHPFTVSIAIRDINLNVQIIGRLMRHIVLVKDDQVTEKTLQEIDELEKEALASLEIVKESFLGDPKDVEDVRTALINWRPIRQEILSHFKAGKLEEAINVMNTKGNNYVTLMTKEIGDVSAYSSKKAEAFVIKAQKNSDASEFWTAFMAIATGLLSFFLAYVISQSINVPLALAVTAANKLAEGDISPNLEYHGSDEMADLLQAMKKMTMAIEKMTMAAENIASGDTTVQVTPRSEKDILGKALNKMVTSLNSFSVIALKISQGDLAVVAQPQSERDFLGKSLSNMTLNLKKEITEITGGIIVLASAGAELSSSSTQMSSSFAQTASSVSETTTSLEEVKQMSNLSSQRMKGVAESAQKSLGLAQAGKKASEDSVQAMNRIQAQMNSIADSIVKLSDQTQSIAEIIAAVDDIAEQSNLLAVNASIEAAKAGEEGKGFAVVAQEVKSLARQSKQATAQVRSILNEIQKATNAAVLVTEQGSKAVEVGAKQAQTAGETIILLAGVLNEAAQSSIQVVSSSREQLIGIEQVLGAMENIRTASQQNFDSTRQLSKSAHELDALGKKLKIMIGRYQI